MVVPVERELIGQAWSSLVRGAVPPSGAAPLEVRGTSGLLASHFAVEETAVACVAAALMAACALGRQRGGPPARPVVDRGHVAAAVRSERYFRSPGQPAGSSFAPLSRFWPAADGWVRTHANYPWHEAALLAELGTSDRPESVAAAIAARAAQDIEDAVFAAGGIAAVVRSLAAWHAHPQGEALRREPLIGHRVAGTAPPRRRPPAPSPAAGVRVLDLTRVIAGPVCTRYLAALGAEVLRLDPPTRPDMARAARADTLLGKRSALLDAATADGVATLRRLLGEADVVVCGYRPGALDRFGLGEDALAERHPGLVVVYLDAWGHAGPWAGRRGFDSVVQAPTGIARGESVDGTGPGALPCQLLDHGTGYLAAAAALDGLRRQEAEGGTHVRRLSLARTAAWLTSTPGREPARDPRSDGDDGSPWLDEISAPAGSLVAVRPPGALDGRPLRWPAILTGYGTDPPRWSEAG